MKRWLPSRLVQGVVTLGLLALVCSAFAGLSGTAHAAASHSARPEYVQCSRTYWNEDTHNALWVAPAQAYLVAELLVLRDSVNNGYCGKVYTFASIEWTVESHWTLTAEIDHDGTWNSSAGQYDGISTNAYSASSYAIAAAFYVGGNGYDYSVFTNTDYV